MFYLQAVDIQGIKLCFIPLLHKSTVFNRWQMLLQIFLDFIKAETQLSSSYTWYNAEELCKVKLKSNQIFSHSQIFQCAVEV